jgi:RNA-directed DNA polymerase
MNDDCNSALPRLNNNINFIKNNPFKNLMWNTTSLIYTVSEISRSDWWRRWLFSTNAKDILRRGGLFQCIIFNTLDSKKSRELKCIHLVDDLNIFEKQGGLFRLLILNVVLAEVLMNRVIKLGMEKKFYNTCRMSKHITWAKANRYFKMGTLARRFLIPKLLRIIVERFSDIINRWSSYFSIPIQMTSYMLWSRSNKMNKLIKLDIISLIEKENDHNGNKPNTVTSENGLISNMKVIFIFEIYSSVAILIIMKNIELCQRYDTSVNQSLALYLEQINCRQNGGRITDQANASINLDDSGNRKYFHTRFHGRSILDRQLNSVLLISTHSKLTKRSISYNAREKVKTFRKDKKAQDINWPDKWDDIERKVRIEQMKLCVLAENSHGTVSKKVLSYQRKLALSLNFRLLAVRITTTNKGKNTPGVDGKLINSNEDKWKVVENIRWWILRPDKFKAQPVKRVYIPKSNNKLRPLGIPNIEERCLQALLNLVLEPLVEMNSDRHSYGFRKFRSAKMAIGALRVNLRSNPDHYNKYILDADIEKFFDTISHDWLLKYIPLEITLKIILEKWLKAGSIYLTRFEATERGTPQGGIISPCLANFTLNGLEEYINQKVRIKYRGYKDNRFSIKRKTDKKNKGYKWIPLALQTLTVRYADDFIVIGRSKRMIESCVRPAIEEFLKERGLTLSKDKTKILSVRNGDKIPFLGYCFQYRKKFSPKYNQFNDKLNKEGIACFPLKDNYMKKIKEIKNIFRISYNDTAYTLITKLNPIIRGWANYFNMSQSYYLRNRLNYALYRFIWLWAKRKHPRWGKKRIARFYFLAPIKLRKGWTSSTNTYYSGNHKKWIFRGFTKRSSIYNEFEGGKYIELIDPTVIIETMSARRYRIPSKLETVHAYHPDYEQIILNNQRLAVESVIKTGTLKLKLFKKQNGLCALCKEYLIMDGEDFMPLPGEWHIHHKIERTKGGSKSNMHNMELVHSSCHVAHHKKVNEQNDKN